MCFDAKDSIFSAGPFLATDYRLFALYSSAVWLLRMLEPSLYIVHEVIFAMHSLTFDLCIVKDARNPLLCICGNNRQKDSVLRLKIVPPSEELPILRYFFLEQNSANQVYMLDLWLFFRKKALFTNSAYLIYFNLKLNKL